MAAIRPTLPAVTPEALATCWAAVSMADCLSFMELLVSLRAGLSSTAVARVCSCCSSTLLTAALSCTEVSGAPSTPVAPAVLLSWVWVVTTIRRAMVAASLPASLPSWVKSASAEVPRPSWLWMAAAASLVLLPVAWLCAWTRVLSGLTTPG